MKSFLEKALALSKTVQRKNLAQKLFSFGAVIFSAVAFISVVKPANAVDIQRGRDYSRSPAGGTVFTFDPAALGLPGSPFTVPLQGKPVAGFPGNTDTLVERQADCTFVGGECTVPMEALALAVESINPVNVAGTLYNVLVTLDRRDANGDGVVDNRTLGGINLRQNGTFSSFLGIRYKADFTPVSGGSTLTTFGGFDVRQDEAEWSNTPPPDAVLVRGPNGDPLANCHTASGPCSNTDFFAITPVRLRTNSPAPQLHTVVPATSVPEANANLGLLACGLLGASSLLKLKRNNTEEVSSR
ncbi:hypothetical protein [Aphanothece sacrum]|uniref:Uncharacterized protein n=1 Tax=Aphanothece sacrum FPU1 TaxID=1920663 RepID=A0A401IJ06_APHSA|nr:hypothetical protein [Aphanothece sacrum]GBF81295.1 hypothetical protein AsFPU1_2707 [Aphanothece sacrum FPU1]GBF83355.1 hypothetical protein AsFPU3_0397 [Aphanothece sacrum FPU3]